MNNIIQLHDYAKLANDPNVLVSVEVINPDTAAKWLRCNRLNRPVRRNHVAFLAREMEEGLWQVNGQAIIISDSEDVLDGQHRLLAVIESGVTIKTLVVYGVKKDAFKTIDTGAARSGADALAVWNPGRTVGITKAVGTAVQWCVALEKGNLGQKQKLANAEVIEYVNDHPSLWKCAEKLAGYPKDSRPLSLGVGTALYEMFQRKDFDIAEDFMKNVYTGEFLSLTTPEYILRSLLLKDQRRAANYPMTIRVRMSVKAWNLKRRGMDGVKANNVAVNPGDGDKITIL